MQWAAIFSLFLNFMLALSYLALSLPKFVWVLRCFILVMLPSFSIFNFSSLILLQNLIFARLLLFGKWLWSIAPLWQMAVIRHCSLRKKLVQMWTFLLLPFICIPKYKGFLAILNCLDFNLSISNDFAKNDLTLLLSRYTRIHKGSFVFKSS